MPLLLALLVWFAVLTDVAAANVFSLRDYDAFHELNVKMRPLGLDIAGFITKPPMPRGGGLADTVRTQDCMIVLAGNFDGLDVKLSSVGTLVGLAAQMIDQADELLVLRLLSNRATGFLEQLKYHQQTLEITATKCSSDGATVAKSQEIQRAYTEAGTLVRSVLAKLRSSGKLP